MKQAWKDVKDKNSASMKDGFVESVLRTGRGTGYDDVMATYRSLVEAVKAEGTEKTGQWRPWHDMVGRYGEDQVHSMIKLGSVKFEVAEDWYAPVLLGHIECYMKWRK